MTIIKTSAVCVFSVLLGLSARAMATPVTFTAGTVAAYASSEYDNGSQNQVYFCCEPYSTPLTVTDGNTTSTVTPEITDSTHEFDFNQSMTDYGSYAEGFGATEFVAGPGVSYSIAGSVTFSSDAAEGDFYVYLYDLSSGTYLYDYYNYAFPDGGSAQTLTLDTSGGPLTGTLNDGDSYAWYAEVDTTNAEEVDPTGVGSAAISFGAAVPEPASMKFALVLLPALGFWAWKRRNPLLADIAS